MYVRRAFSARELEIIVWIAAALCFVSTDDQRLKNEGKLDQATGKMKKAAERAIDKAKG